MKAHKCENCGNIVDNKPQMQNLNCEHCGNALINKEISTKNIKNIYNESVQVPQSNLAQYHCDFCGCRLSISNEDNTFACPSCGDSNLTRKDETGYAPDAVLPFAYSKENATENLYNWIKKHKFAPNVFKKMVRKENLFGFYTPVWNFDCTANTKFSGVGVDEHKDKFSGTHSHKHPFKGKLSNSYTNVYFSANKKFCDDALNSLGNFNMQNLKVYSPKYLKDYVGVNFDIDIHTCYKKFSKYVNKSEEQKTRSMYEARHSRIENFRTKSEVYNPKYSLVYLPIWGSCYTYKNKQYSFYINGTSGKVSGKLPKSFWKIFLLCFGFTIVVLGAVALGLVLGLNGTPDVPAQTYDYPTPFLL